MENALSVYDGAVRTLISQNNIGNARIIEGLYTDIAVSDKGFIAIYHPYEPAVKKSLLTGPGKPEEPERLDVIHISQVSSFDLSIDEKTSSGAGGALLGGLIGGTTGAIIGGSATGGKTTVKSIRLRKKPPCVGGKQIDI